MVRLSVPLVTGSGVVDVCIADDRYAIAATNYGIDVVDLFSMEVISSGLLPDVPRCVGVDESLYRKLYVGTTSSGVFTMPLNLVKVRQSNFTSALTQVFTTSTVPSLTHNQVGALAAGNGRVLVSTAAGIDLITHSVLRSFRLLASGSTSCFLTATGGAYWNVVGSGVEVNYDIFPTSGTGVISVDFSYNGNSSVPQLISPDVTDIYIAQGDPNIITFATSSGGMVVEEFPGSESLSLVKTFFTPDSLASSAISPTASYSSGFSYLASSSELKIFDLSSNTVTGTHTSVSSSNYQVLSSGNINVVRVTTIG